MPTVLCAWEIGEAFGHITRFQPIAMALKRSSIRVCAAFRDLSRLGSACAECFDGIFQAPAKNSRIAVPRHLPATFAQLLHNNGFETVEELRALVIAWEHLFSIVKPDLILGDLAPIATIVGQSLGIATAIIGTGFACPPATTPLTVMVRDPRVDVRYETDERTVHATICEVLSDRKWPIRNSIGEFFAHNTATFLSTYPELDHYGRREEGCHYYGVWEPGVAGRALSTGPLRAFAYLKPFAGMTALHAVLEEWKIPTIICTDRNGVRNPSDTRDSSVFFHDGLIDLDAIASGLDFAVCNGNHGTTANLLRRGVPVLAIPLHYEQAITAFRLAEARLGVALEPTNNTAAYAGAIGSLLCNPNFRKNALDFARKYEGLGGMQSVNEICTLIDGLLRR